MVRSRPLTRSHASTGRAAGPRGGERPVAAVTGASAGVGRATAGALARAGFDVGLLSRGEAGLEAARAEVEAQDARALAVPADVADPAQVDAAADRVEGELGPIDAWVNAAMTTVFAWTRDVEPAELRRATEVTYLGQVHGTLAALARMRPRDRGRVVNVGSALAFAGIPLQAAYCGAKFAVRGFSQSVRAELLAEGSGVTLSTVELPGLDTPQFEWCMSRLPNHPRPVAPVYRPEDAAETVLAAVRDGRRSVTLGTWNRLVIAGARLAPSVISHYVARTGVDSQQIPDEATDPDRPANLWEPVDGDRDQGTRGRFADRAHGVRSPELLRSLPANVRALLLAARDAARFRARARRERLDDRRVGARAGRRAPGP